MKTTCLLFLTMTWAALAQGTVPSRATETNRPPSRASLTKASRPKALVNGRQGSLPGKVVHQPGANKSGGAPKGGLIPNATVPNAMPVRRSSNVQPSGLRGDNVSHRGVNPARIDGGIVPHGRGLSGYPQSHLSQKP